jgi:hypothetical protein
MNDKATDNAESTDEGVHVKVDRTKYTPTRSASGAKSLHNGDPVAEALAGLAIQDLYKVADTMIGENDFRKKYAKLNVGMQRMNVGNRLRAACGAVDKEKETEGAGVKKLAALTSPLQKAAKVEADKIAAEKKAKSEAAAKAKAEKASKKAKTEKKATPSK